MKFDSQLWPATENSWVVSCGGKTIPRWRTAAVLKIDISPYLSEKSSDFHEILYRTAHFKLDERHVIKNEKVALNRLRVRQNVFLVCCSLDILLSRDSWSLSPAPDHGKLRLWQRHLIKQKLQHKNTNKSNTKAELFGSRFAVTFCVGDIWQVVASWRHSTLCILYHAGARAGCWRH